MKPRIQPALLTVRLFLVLLLALTALQITGNIGRAAPLAVSRYPQTSAAAPFICTSIVTNQFCNVRVVLLIDDTGSMRTNDPAKIRNQGAKNLVDILSQEYYQQAVEAQKSDPNVILPDVEVAVIHFSTCKSSNPLYNCSSDVKFNSGWLPITQQSQINDDIDWLATQPHYYDVLQYTHFIEPFQDASDLFSQLSAANPSGCTKRLMLLLTDGTPEDATGPYTGDALKNEMTNVKSVVSDFISQPASNQIYVTAFKIASDYWSKAEPYWVDIAGRSNVTLNNSLDAVASRMEQIATTVIGSQSSVLSPEPGNSKLFKFTVLPHTASLRISYFKLDQNATLTLKDPQGNDIVPNGDSVTQTGKGTSIEVWTLKDPAPGNYQLTRSAVSGIITTTPVFSVDAQLKTPTVDAPLLQFTPGLISFKLVDSQGQPVLPGDFPSGFNFSVTSEITQGDAATPLTLTQADSAYQANWTPLSAGPGTIKVSVDLTDANQVSILKCQGGIGDFTVDPVTVKTAPPNACTDVNTSIAVPLQVINERTGQATGIGLPIQWQVDSSTSPGGQKVDSPVETVDAKTGQYQFTLTPLAAEDIVSHITASVPGTNGLISLFDDKVTISVCQLPPALTPTTTPTPTPTPTPSPSCEPDSFGIYLLWIAALLLAVILLFRLTLSKRKREHTIPSWLLALLLILLLILFFFWCPAIPFWLLLLLLLLLLIIFLLIRIVTDDEKWNISIWFWLYLILLILLLVIWLFYYSSFWIYLLLTLLILFIILLIIWWTASGRDEDEPFSIWWLLILLIFLISLWVIILGSLSFWLVLILLLIWPLLLFMLWLIVEAGEDRSTDRFWLTLFLILILALVWIIFFSAYWAYLAELLIVLFVIWAILWLLYRYHNRLWGVIGIVDDDEHLRWSAPLGDHDAVNGKTSYEWKFDEPICSVMRLRLRSWDKPHHHLTILVELTDGKRRFVRSLEEWQDCGLPDGCRVVWMEEIPAREPDRRPRRGGSYPIEAVEGIGEVYGSSFRKIGIRSTGGLLKVAGTRAGRRDAAKRIGLSAKLILEWVNRADLMRVQGVGEEYSDLLEASGVDTVRELRRRNPANLYADVCKVNQQKHLARRDPTLGQVTNWVKAAQKMKVIVE